MTTNDRPVQIVYSVDGDADDRTEDHTESTWRAAWETLTADLEVRHAAALLDVHNDGGTTEHALAEYHRPPSRHDDGSIDADRYVSAWLDGPVVVSRWEPGAVDTSDAATKTETGTLPRLDFLCDLYTTSLGVGPVTTADSFVVDLIADTLLWALHRMPGTTVADLADLADRGARHAADDAREIAEALIVREQSC